MALCKYPVPDPLTLALCLLDTVLLLSSIRSMATAPGGMRPLVVARQRVAVFLTVFQIQGGPARFSLSLGVGLGDEMVRETIAQCPTS